MFNQPKFSDDEEIARLVRSTLHAVSQTSNRRLNQLRPEYPRNGRLKRCLFNGWQRQLAIVFMVAVLCFGFYGFYQSQQQPAWQGVPPTRLAVTATFTSEPTATWTDERIAATETAVAVETQSAAIKKPAATPVAALFRQHLANNDN